MLRRGVYHSKNLQIGYGSSYVKNIKNIFNKDSSYTNTIQNIITETLKNPPTINSYVGGKKYVGNQICKQITPINNNKYACEYTEANETILNKYLEEFTYYKHSLESLSDSDINTIFNKAGKLLQGKYREQMIAYTIISQGKSVYEAELDAICELGDFWRFNRDFKSEITNRSLLSPRGTVNKSYYNSLNGFVAAITPFNFTAIGGNLATTPILFRNSVIWKPSNNAVLSNHLVFEILLEAGLPAEAIAFTPADPHLFTNTVVKSPDMSGLLYTGSSEVFNELLTTVYNRDTLDNYKSYPTIVGETGGKNWHFISSDVSNEKCRDIAIKTVKSAFGYSGQKCSACSIVYVPDNLYDTFVDELLIARQEFMTSPAFKNYGLIHANSLDKTAKLIENLKTNNDKYTMIAGGTVHSNEQYYCEPTIVESNDHNDMVFSKEFFAPVLAIYKYSGDAINETMELCRSTNNYALTGSIFSDNDEFKKYALWYFKNKCGNFYINDKSTGSIVGQQPFGGSGKSGTNDKAGDINLLYKLFNQQSVKTNLHF